MPPPLVYTFIYYQHQQMFFLTNMLCDGSSVEAGNGWYELIQRQSAILLLYAVIHLDVGDHDSTISSLL